MAPSAHRSVSGRSAAPSRVSPATASTMRLPRALQNPSLTPAPLLASRCFGSDPRRDPRVAARGVAGSATEAERSRGPRGQVTRANAAAVAVLNAGAAGGSAPNAAGPSITATPAPSPTPFVSKLPFTTGSLRPAAGTPLASALPAEDFEELTFASIPEALEAFGRGELLVVLDDEDRENEGDLIGAAELATEESLAFMVRHTSGVVCVGTDGAVLDRLGLPLMVSDPKNEELMLTAFTVTVDAREGITTGISAAERAHTLRTLASATSTSASLKKPGHIFPLRARPGGVLERGGHTEAGADLARLCGLTPAGYLCEIVAEDGTMARAPQLLRFAKEHGLKAITIADLAAYRRKEGL